jgi:hypothetical protein
MKALSMLGNLLNILDTLDANTSLFCAAITKGSYICVGPLSRRSNNFGMEEVYVIPYSAGMDVSDQMLDPCTS